MTKTSAKKSKATKKTAKAVAKKGVELAVDIPMLELKQVTFDVHPANKNEIGFTIRVKGGGEINCVVGFNNPGLVKSMKRLHSKRALPASVEDEILEFTGECLVCIEDYFGIFDDDVSDVFVVWVK